MAEQMNVAMMDQSKLAVNGGDPVRSTSFPEWPVFGHDEIDAASSVLASGRVNYWTGEEGRQFEREFASFAGTKYAVAVANGSVALELALYALEIGPGDEVIVPSRSFVASGSCVVVRGATPVFADVDPDSQNITADTVARVLTPRTRAIIAVHLAGWPCDMDPILAIAYERGLKVIEDCAQAQGATYKGRPVGSLGHAAAFSFCQDKIMTTCGEGGMLTTDDRAVWERAWSFKDHGKNYEAAHRRVNSNGFRWVHDSCGTNWRMTEMQSAVGRVLLRKVPSWLERRQHLAATLNRYLGDIAALRIPARPPEIRHANYKCYVFLRPEHLHEGWNQSRIIEAIKAEGVPCFAGSCSEIYLEGGLKNFRPPVRLSVARELGETSLMFLVHPTLSEQEMLDTYAAVEKVLRKASKRTPSPMLSNSSELSRLRTVS